MPSVRTSLAVGAAAALVVGVAWCQPEAARVDDVRFPATGAPAIELQGVLSTPGPASGVGVVLCHPDPKYGGTMRDAILAACEQALLGRGVATLRFNFRGVGESEGEHDDGDGEVDDVLGAAAFLSRREGVRAVAVVGYSFGAYVGFEAVRKDPTIAAFAAIALPLDRDGGPWRRYDRIGEVRRPMLLVTGAEDEISQAERVRKLAARAPGHARFVEVEGADHFLLPPDGEAPLGRIASVVADFITEAVAVPQGDRP